MQNLPSQVFDLKYMFLQDSVVHFLLRQGQQHDGIQRRCISTSCWIHVNHSFEDFQHVSTCFNMFQHHVIVCSLAALWPLSKPSFTALRRLWLPWWDPNLGCQFAQLETSIPAEVSAKKKLPKLVRCRAFRICQHIRKKKGLKLSQTSTSLQATEETSEVSTNGRIPGLC